jgi:hypothetical protein
MAETQTKMVNGVAGLRCSHPNNQHNGHGYYQLNGTLTTANLVYCMSACLFSSLLSFYSAITRLHRLDTTRGPAFCLHLWPAFSVFAIIGGSIMLHVASAWFSKHSISS